MLDSLAFVKKFGARVAPYPRKIWRALDTTRQPPNALYHLSPDGLHAPDSQTTSDSPSHILTGLHGASLQTSSTLHRPVVPSSGQVSIPRYGHRP